jgi:hypothetical protein
VVDLAEPGLKEQRESGSGDDNIFEYAAESERDVDGCVECGVCHAEEYYDWGGDEFGGRAILLRLYIDGRSVSTYKFVYTDKTAQSLA